MAAQPTFSQNTYAGEVFEGFLVRLVEGMDVFDKRLVALHTGINKRLVLPSITLSGNFVQDYAADPTSSGSIAVGEKYIDVTDKMVYVDDFNPNDWRRFWQPFAPTWREAFDYLTMNPKVRESFVSEILKAVGKVNVYNLWQGDTLGTGATYSEFDGIITKLLSAGGYVDAAGTDAPAAFTAGNVGTALAAVMAEIVARPALHERPGLAMIVSNKTKYLYQQQQVATSGKGPIESTIDGRTGIDYYGVQIIASNGFPDNTILATYTDVDPLASNLHVGLRNVNDLTEIVFEKKANGSHNHFFRMDYSIGTQVGVPADCIYYGAQ